MDDHDEEKRTEQNLIVRSGKFKAEVHCILIIEDCARSTVLLKLTTDRHEASRDLFATARLLVTTSRAARCFVSTSS